MCRDLVRTLRTQAVLFITPEGRGVDVPSSRKRRAAELDSHEVRLVRARVIEAFLRILTRDQVGDVVGLRASSVSAELAWLRAQRASGRDRLPWDAPELEQPTGPEAEDTH